MASTRGEPGCRGETMLQLNFLIPGCWWVDKIEPGIAATEAGGSLETVVSRTFVEGLLLHCLTLLHPDKTRRAMPPGVVTHAAAWDKTMTERQRRSMSMLHLPSDNAIFFRDALIRKQVFFFQKCILGRNGSNDHATLKCW